MTAVHEAAVDVAGWLRGVLPPGAALVADSRAVSPGDAFFAYPGERADGRRFVEQALARGAAAVVAEAVPQGGADAAGLSGVAVPLRRVAGLKALAGPIADA
ncbi:MAG: Mur ligase domain-containing protein [Burkholderiales bacterium]